MFKRFLFGSVFLFVGLSVSACQPNWFFNENSQRSCKSPTPGCSYLREFPWIAASTSISANQTGAQGATGVLPITPQANKRKNDTNKGS